MVARLFINIFWASCVSTIQTFPKREPEICRDFVEAAIFTAFERVGNTAQLHVKGIVPLPSPDTDLIRN